MTRCTWCDHDPHPAACPRKIQRGTLKNPDKIPCPCVRREP